MHDEPLGMAFRANVAARLRSQRAGFTLVELMIVVAIISASVLAFAPGISRAMRDQAVSTAARELIRIGRRARSETFGYLRAHLIWITPSTGRVQLLRAPTNSCLLTAWADSQTDCTADASKRGGRCLEDVSITNWTSRTTISLYEDAGNDSYNQLSRALCYAPNGVVSHAQVSDISKVASGLLETTTGGGFVYALLTGTSPPTSSSRVHRVLFPLGGSPRGMR